MIVIGAGPAGYVCAIRASQLGQRVAIVEKEWLGGVCLNVGCIPSKSLLKNAEVAELLRHGGKDFGFKMDNLQLDFAAAVQRSRQISRRLVKGVEFLLKKNKIDVLSGTAELTSASVVKVTGADGATRSASAGGQHLRHNPQTARTGYHHPAGGTKRAHGAAGCQPRLRAANRRNYTDRQSSRTARKRECAESLPGCALASPRHYTISRAQDFASQPSFGLEADIVEPSLLAHWRKRATTQTD